MTTILIIVILGMIAYIIKALIDINSLVLMITKDKEVIKSILLERAAANMEEDRKDPFFQRGR